MSTSSSSAIQQRRSIVVAGGDSARFLPPANSTNHSPSRWTAQATFSSPIRTTLRVMKYKPNSRKGEAVVGHGSLVVIQGLMQPISRMLIDKNDRLYTYWQNSTSSPLGVIVWSSQSSNGTLISLTNFVTDAFAIDSDFNIHSVYMDSLYIYMAPKYTERTYKNLFGELSSRRTLPKGSSNIFVDADNNLLVIDTQDRRVLRTAMNERYADTVSSCLFPVRI